MIRAYYRDLLGFENLVGLMKREKEMYPHSSYCALIATGPTAIMRKEVLKLFGGLKEFENRIADKDRRIDLSEQLLLENEDD